MHQGHLECVTGNKTYKCIRCKDGAQMSFTSLEFSLPVTHRKHHKLLQSLINLSPHLRLQVNRSFCIRRRRSRCITFSRDIKHWFLYWWHSAGVLNHVHKLGTKPYRGQCCFIVRTQAHEHIRLTGLIDLF